MNKLMRILVFFDLPVKTKQERRDAAHLRKFLLNNGYHMIQYSVYARICNGADSVALHENRLRAEIPPHGSIRMLVITEKQYHSIRILLGTPTVYDEPQSTDSLMVF